MPATSERGALGRSGRPRAHATSAAVGTCDERKRVRRLAPGAHGSAGTVHTHFRGGCSGSISLLYLNRSWSAQLGHAWHAVDATQDAQASAPCGVRRP